MHTPNGTSHRAAPISSGMLHRLCIKGIAKTLAPPTRTSAPWRACLVGEIEKHWSAHPPAYQAASAVGVYLRACRIDHLSGVEPLSQHGEQLRCRVLTYDAQEEDRQVPAQRQPGISAVQSSPWRTAAVVRMRRYGGSIGSIGSRSKPFVACIYSIHRSMRVEDSVYCCTADHTGQLTMLLYRNSQRAPRVLHT